MEANNTKPATRGTSKRAKIIQTVVALVVVLVVFSACMSGGKDDKRSDAAGAADSKAAATMAPAKKAPKPSDPIKAAEQAANVEGLEILKSTAKGKPVIAQFPISDNFTKSGIATVAQDDTAKILKAVRENVPSFTMIYVQGSFATKDEYGNESDSTILNVFYGKSTVDKINFDGIDSGSIWTIRDGGNINSNILG
ncbi:hypothetical protein [Arthrobacter rhombi]|uniref:hypothetical protein n=1 Tax=Arthrobacter rhombi TaxID=71253 RepID=UPI003FD24526